MTHNDLTIHLHLYKLVPVPLIVQWRLGCIYYTYPSFFYTVILQSLTEITPRPA